MYSTLKDNDSTTYSNNTGYDAPESNIGTYTIILEIDEVNYKDLNISTCIA